MLEAERYYSAVNGGLTGAQLMRCSGGRDYLIKASSDTFPRNALNELLASRLGELVGAPVLVGEPVLIDPSLVADEPSYSTRDGDRLDAGVQYAVQWINDAKPLARIDLDRISNKGDVPWVYVFDQWIFNLDRHSNMGNLLFADVDGDGTHRMLMIDHGHAFTGRSWTVDRLAQYAGIAFSDFGEVYGTLAGLIRGRDPFEQQLAVLESLSHDSIESAVSSIPCELWDADPERSAVTDFLFSRRSRPREAVMRWRNRFPKWT